MLYIFCQPPPAEVVAGKHIYTSIDYYVNNNDNTTVTPHVCLNLAYMF